VKINLKYYRSGLLIPLIGVLWIGTSWVLSKFWGYGLLQGLGPTSIIIFFLWIYDKYLWKCPVLKLLITAPNISGRYSGILETTWQKEIKRVRCITTVKQTASTIKIQCEFIKDDENNTESISKEAFISFDEVGDPSLYFYYQNQGSCLNNDTLNQHDGMNVLKIIKNKKQIQLKGYYFTNRDPQTQGKITLNKIIKEKNNEYS